MILKEDGHLDIEKVMQLSEEELRVEKLEWSGKEWYDWFDRDVA